MRHLRRLLARTAIKAAILVLRTAATLLDRQPGPSQTRATRPPDRNCSTCSDCVVPGVFWPTEIHEDNTHAWLERCDECRRFDSDIHAADEVIRLGLSNELGVARPAGSTSDSLYAKPITTGHTSGK